MSTSTLDPVELLHLAIEAASRDAHGQAIEYLKQALDQQQPAGDYARTAYFLGAEYAQIGMIDRAVAQMAQAVEMEPSLVIARFQLGLLHLTSGRVAEAAEAWAPLESLAAADQEHPLVLFKRGLEALARDEFETCRELLTRGIALNHDNLPLNGDMTKVLEALPANPGLGDQVGAESGPQESRQGDHLFLSAYKGNSVQ